MSYNASARRYQTAQIESATPGQILLALYDGCIRFCKAAQLHIEAGEVSEKGHKISKAVAILGELRSTLDHDQSPELCQSLDQLYIFFQEQLSTANIKMDATYIDPVIRIMTDLRDAWTQAVGEVESEKPAAPNAPTAKKDSQAA